MKLRKNRRTETEALNVARSFFEQNDCIFQPVDLSNDYGKDAYLDLTHGQTVSGTCIAAQIKGGTSYKRADGYAIPVDDHFDVWRNSSLPVAGIVYDPSDKGLRWCSITGYLESLRGERPSSIPVPADNLLTSESLNTDFRPYFERESRRTAAGNCILDLCSESVDRRRVAISDCFAHGRSDPRVLISLRYLMNMLDDDAFMDAIFVLAHVTPHPDILWTKDNWITEDICKLVSVHFRWSPNEALRLLKTLEPEGGIYRGGFGESVYMLLLEDPRRREMIDEALALALDTGDENAAWFAFYVSVYWARNKAKVKIEELIAWRPEVQSLELFNETLSIVAEQGFVTLLE